MPPFAEEESIAVPSRDPPKPSESEELERNKENTAGKEGDPNLRNLANKKKEHEENEEDAALRGELDMLVERLSEPETTLYRPALESLRTLIRTATSSMTSVPKPLKFLRPHYPRLKALYAGTESQAAPEANTYWAEPSRDRALFAEILSVLAMTYSDGGARDTLAFRIAAVKTYALAKQSGAETDANDPGVWGHEYMRHLAAEIGDEYNSRVQRGEHGAGAVALKKATGADATPTPKKEANGEAEVASDRHPSAGTATYQDLLDMALLVVPFSLKHNAEADAVDLLLELEAIERLPPFVDEQTYDRVCRYMISCVSLLVPPDDLQFLRTAHTILRAQDRFNEALIVAIRIGDRALIKEDFWAPKSPVMRKQLGFLLGRNHIPIEWVQDEEAPIEDAELVECISNTKLSETFIWFAKELNVFEPKTIEDVYKSYLGPDTGRSALSSGIDSARGNLARTFVNALVNAGCGNDPLMAAAPEGESWIYKTKDEGMISATASLGLSMLWDTEGGLSAVDKYTYSSEEYVKAGALIATGLTHAGIRTEVDAPLALLSEHLEGSSNALKASAVIGLAIAYAGSQRDDIITGSLLPLIQDPSHSMQVASLAALAIGFIAPGSAHEEAVPDLMDALLTRSDTDLDSKWSRFFSAGLALLFLARQDADEAILETLKIVEHPIGRQTEILVEAAAYAGTGNVLKIQKLLHVCLENPADALKKPEEAAEADANASGAGNAAAADEEEEEKSLPPNAELFQSYAVFGIALVAMGEDVGADMSLRHLRHLMHYGEAGIRRAVPLALALLYASRPQTEVIDTLSKYSHDTDLDVAINAILAMGFVGCGTNNAKLAQLLRQLAGYYASQANALFATRVAQGLVVLGKGLLNINPFHTDRQLLGRAASAGLIGTLVACLDSSEFTVGRESYLLYLIAPAIYPRFLVTYDEELKPLAVSVRVGKAVDTTGQAGTPRTISGFQTHDTPVRLNTEDRAEMATEEYLSYASVLETFVILHRNPGFEQADEDVKMA